MRSRSHSARNSYTAPRDLTEPSRFKNTVQLDSIIARSQRSKEFCNTFWGRAEVRDAREATTAIGANAKTLVFASTTNTDHAPEGLSGGLRRIATTLRGDTVQRLPRELCAKVGDGMKA
jgi:hypothetical protein